MQRYMVVERFKPGAGRAVYERLHERGRMLPDGLVYEDSWVDRGLTICFQLVRTSERNLLEKWFQNWADLIDFEVVPLRAE